MQEQKDLLQCYINKLAQRIPALATAKVITFGQQFEVWINPYTTLVVGSRGTILLWLGCVALTKRVRSYDHYQPHILHAVICSAERAGVL